MNTTLVHPTPSPSAAGARPFPHIDLPSGPPPQAAAAPAEPPPRKVGLLTWLLAGTAVTGVLGMIGAGLFVTLSRIGHPVPPAADWLSAPQAVSPQQPPAQPPQPTTTRQPSSAPAAAGVGVPAAPAAAAPATAPRSGADDLRAIKQPRPAAAAALPPASTVPAGLANPSATRQPDTQAAPAAGPESRPAPSGDAPGAILGAAPAPPDLILVVSKLADDIAQERKSDAELRQQIARLLQDTDQKLSEFDRRLTIAEARAVPAFAERMPARPALASAAAAGALSAMRASLSAAPPPGARRYEIRAASPGVAVLGTLDGAPAVVEIAVGDQVPGYGRVNGIGQKGNAWAVQCDLGTIQ